jgi:hypothetical protein
MKFLRYTACELAVVRKKLVEEDQMLNLNCVMIAIYGRARLVRMTLKFMGEIEAMVLE